MIPAKDIIALVRAEMPDAEVILEDLTGGQDHWNATVISDAFDGGRSVRCHRMVYKALSEPLKGPLHALQLKTLTFAAARAEGILE